MAGYEHIDLTHKLSPDMPVWPGHPPMCHDLCESYETGAVSKFYAVSLGEHTGTHLDAPVHFVAGGASIDQVPVTQLALRLACLQFPERTAGALISADDIASWEKQNGAIRADDAVFFHFGWDRYFIEDRALFLAGWPGLSEDAALYLAKGNVRMVGCDCLSIDSSRTEHFPAHRVLLGNGILIGENFNNLGRLPAFSTLIGLPLPIANGSGAPIRAVALV
ncbi:cyclase family protein [Martelella lutilitoris]|nr:cyclase family protein [Martelella lutilitoris]